MEWIGMDWGYVQWKSEWIGLGYFGNGFRYNYGEDIDIIVVVGW